MSISSTVTAHDVAAYILLRTGEITAMKLQKLAYYSQAWSLVWDDAPLFSERIEAWANGPVVRDLYAVHKGLYSVSAWPNGDPTKLSVDQAATVDAVLDFYGKKNSQWLSELTHREDPWRLARVGLADGDRGAREISHASMMEYYDSIQPNG